MCRSPPRHTGAECAGGGCPPAESGVLPTRSPEVRTPDAAERGPGAGMFFTFLNLLTWSSVNLPELPHDINDHRHKALHGTNNFTQQNGFHIAHAARVTDIVERRRRRSRRCRVAHNWLHNHNETGPPAFVTASRVRSCRTVCCGKRTLMTHGP